MNDPTIKILKLTSGEDIVCKTFDECKDLKGRNISITDPVVLNQIRMPRGDMIVESYILSPWVSLANTAIFEISTDHIIVAADTKETLKDNYTKFIDSREASEISEVEAKEMDTEQIQEIVDKFINTLEEEHNENKEPPKRRGRTIH
jgi:hypothetical protein